MEVRNFSEGASKVQLKDLGSTKVGKVYGRLRTRAILRHTTKKNRKVGFGA